MAGFDGHPEEIWRPLAQMPEVELVAIADEASAPDALAAALRQAAVAKARRYATLRELLAAEKLDMVAVCNNNGRRAAAILACAERKLDVIAEKPLGLNRGELDAVYAAVKRHGIHLGMLLPMRFDPQYLAMRRIVASGAIGEVLQMDAQKSYQLGVRPDVANARGDLRQHDPVDRDPRDRPDAVGQREALHGGRGDAIARGLSRGGRHGNRHRHAVQNGQRRVGHAAYGLSAAGDGGQSRRRSPARGRDEGHRGIPGEQRRDADDAGREARDGPRLARAGLRVRRTSSTRCVRGAKPALGWDEIVRANEAMLAAQSASVAHRFVAVRPL